jgi:hypothetical protein
MRGVEDVCTQGRAFSFLGTPQTSSKGFWIPVSTYFVGYTSFNVIT